MKEFRTTFCINSAHAIAKLLLASGCIAEEDLMKTIQELMDGTIKLRGAMYGKEKSREERKARKEKQVA